MDTSGLCSSRTLAELASESDLILYDVKLIDPAAHMQHTGANNALILDNLAGLADSMRRNPGKRLWIRTPMIPRATLNEENIHGIGAWLSQQLPGLVERWELCAFNNLCSDKYQRLGMEWDYADTALTQGELDQAGVWARTSGFDPQRVFISGPTQAVQ